MENTLIRSERCPDCGEEMLWTQNAWPLDSHSDAAFRCHNGHVSDPATTKQCPACGVHDTRHVEAGPEEYGGLPVLSVLHQVHGSTVRNCHSICQLGLSAQCKGGRLPRVAAGSSCGRFPCPAVTPSLPGRRLENCNPRQHAQVLRRLRSCKTTRIRPPRSHRDLPVDSLACSSAQRIAWAPSRARPGLAPATPAYLPPTLSRKPRTS